MNSLFTHFTAFQTANTPSGEGEYIPYVTIYKGKGLPAPKRTSFQTMEMIVQFNRLEDRVDPFSTANGRFPETFKNTSDTRDKMARYTTRQQTYQFRTSVFSVGVFGKVARLFRWDRAGCQVTEPIKYTTEEGNRQLSEFFVRFDRLADDPEARGWDPTVKDATAKEVDDFAEAVRTAREEIFGPARRRTRARKEINPKFLELVSSVGDPSKYPRRRVSIPDGKVTRDYIVGDSTSMVDLPTGRSTRGYVAMAVETKRLVFLKDSWRLDLDSAESEDYWYKLLRRRRRGDVGMKNVGAYSHGSEVYATRNFVRCRDNKQRSLTQLYAKDYGRAEAMWGYIHHRVVQPELYLPLKTFRDSKHFTSVMYDIALGEFILFIRCSSGVDPIDSSRISAQGWDFPP